MEGLRYFLPLREGQTYIVFPHPHRQASMRNLAASDRRFDRKLTPVCVHPSFEYLAKSESPKRENMRIRRLHQLLRLVSEGT